MSTLSFIVGDRTFDISSDRIPDECLLSELSKEDFGTSSREYMLDVDPEKFALVHKYLIEGTLSRELYCKVQDLFKYLMLDYNEFGYPQEFFEIKKKEDYIRKNFNDPTFVNHPMRSMYYNLIELTEDVYNDIFANFNLTKDSRIIMRTCPSHHTPLTYSEFANNINNIVKFYKLENLEKLVIAGGILITTALGLPPKDVDLFLVDGNVPVIEKLLSLYDKKENPHFYRSANCISVRIFPREMKNTPRDMRDMIHKMFKCELQIILRKYTSVSEVVAGFDVDCCGICYELSTKKFWLTPRAMYAIKQRTNVVDFGRLSPSYEHRLIKYARRGFGIFVPFFEPIKINAIKVSKFITEKSMEDGKRRRCKTYEEVSGSGLDLLIKSMYSEFMFNEKKIPSDYDAFVFTNTTLLDAFRYKFTEIHVPIKNLKDVGKYMSSLGIKMHITNMTRKNGKVCIIANYQKPNFKIDMLSPIEEKYGVIIYGAYAFEDICVSYNQVEKSLAAKSRMIRYYSTKNYKNIISLSDTTYSLLKDFTPLTRGVELMTVNPGQQLTGSFHKLVLDDYRVWYKSDFYTL